MFKKDESEEQESSSSATANVQSKSQPIDYDLLSESIVGASAANYGNVEMTREKLSLIGSEAGDLKAKVLTLASIQPLLRRRDKLLARKKDAEDRRDELASIKRLKNINGGRDVDVKADVNVNVNVNVKFAKEENEIGGAACK